MKFMFCLGSLDKGGTQRVVTTLANYFIKKNDVTLVVTADRVSAYFLDKKIKVISLDKESGRSNLKRIKYLKKIVKENNFDIIVSMQPEPSFRMLFLSKVAKCPIVISVRNDPKTEYKSLKRQILMRMLYGRANGYVFQTNESKSYFNKSIQAKCRVIANPLNDKFLIDSYDGVRKKTIVTVGRFVEQKNQQMLIDAFAIVNKTHPEYVLKLYGEGPLEHALNQKVNQLGIDNKVKFMGISNTIEKDIIDDGIFVLSSNYEGMPNALMEAMALGLPCISTDCPCGGPKDLIENYKNGILVETGNSKALADSISFCIDNANEMVKFGKNAEKVKEKYNSKLIINQWELYLKEVIYKYAKH